MSFLVNDEGGYFSLSHNGYIALAVLIVVLVVIMIAIFMKKTEKVKITTEQMVCSAVMLALALVASYIKIFSMPWGGSVTLFSMLFVCIVGYLFGARIGLITAFIYGILHFLLGGNSYILSLWQVCFDYLFAFTALGLSGFFCNKKNGLTVGYIVGIFGRGVMASIAGYLYWMEYMPESFPKSLTIIYPICYNFAYILVEGIVTIIVINLPPVKKAILRLKNFSYGE